MTAEPIVCNQCEKEITSNPVTEKYYLWADGDDTDECSFCSDECLMEYEDETLARACDSCGRRLHDSNGYIYNFKDSPSNSMFDRELCNRCFREHVLQHGLPLGDLEDGDRLSREMEVDYNSDELEKNGWKLRRCKDESETAVRKRAIKLARAGNAVLLRLSGWDESIYIRPRKD